MSASVVSSSEAIDEAFCSALRTASPYDNAGLHQVLVGLRGRVEALVLFHVLDLRHDDESLGSGIRRNVSHGSSIARRTICRPTSSSPVSVRPSSTLPARRSATPPPATMPSSTAAFVACVAQFFDARLLLLHLGFRGRPHLDDRHTAHEFRQPLLQLLAVVVRGRVLNLRADLLDAPLNRGRRAGAFDDRRRVLVNRDLLGLAQILELEVLELDAEVLGDGTSAGEDRDVFEHRLTAVAEAGRLHRGSVQRAPQLVDDERGQRLALDVLGDDEERLTEPRDLFQDGEGGPSSTKSFSRG